MINKPSDCLGPLVLLGNAPTFFKHEHVSQGKETWGGRGKAFRIMGRILPSRAFCKEQARAKANGKHQTCPESVENVIKSRLLGYKCF